MKARVRRTTALLAASVAVTAGVLTVSPAPALAAGTASMEAQFVARLNAAREAAGLHPYAVAADLAAVARRHSAEMASTQNLHHNPSLTTDVAQWQAVGENVGEGPTVTDVHRAFMHSPEHRANILDSDFTQVGVGVSVDRDGVVWVTEDFREPMLPSAPPPRRRIVTAAPHLVAPRQRAISPAGRTLATRLAAMRARPAHAAADPVAAAFAYLSTVSTLDR